MNVLTNIWIFIIVGLYNKSHRSITKTGIEEFFIKQAIIVWKK